MILECTYEFGDMTRLEKIHWDRVDPFFCRQKLDDFESSFDLENLLRQEAELGEEVVASLPKQFLERNHGKYLAIAYSGNRLVLSNTLGELNDQLIKVQPRENYYICRIGYSSIAKI